MGILGSWDLGDGEFFKGRLDFLNQVEIECHLGVSSLVRALEFVYYKLGVRLDFSFGIPISLVSELPTIKASYSASLFMVLKLYRMACWLVSPSSETKTSLNHSHVNYLSHQLRKSTLKMNHL